MTDQPNILFICSDQHNARTLGCETHLDVLTPHIDQLAAEGTRFTRAICQDGVCAPSRCSMFSGLYPRTLGCMTNLDRSAAMDDVIPLQQALRQAGYFTAAFGKRHLHQACDHGWDIAASHLLRESPDDNYVQWVGDQGYAGVFDDDWAAEWGCGAEGTTAHDRQRPTSLMSVRVSQLPPDLTMEAWTRDRTIQFLRSRRGENQPFFCFASFYRPHQPYTPLAQYFNRFDRTHWGRGRRAGDGIAMPPSLRQPVADLPPMFQEQHTGSNRVWRLDLARADEQIYRDYIAAYYALVEEIDDHIGAILESLDCLGLSRNTIVIYVSDHGDFVGTHGMVEKCSSGHNVYEQTLRVPLIMRWPDHIRAGQVCDGLAELVDIYPTLMQLTVSPTPKFTRPLQGRSLAATLCQGRPIDRAFSVSENWSQSAVVTSRYTLGVWRQPPMKSDIVRDDRCFGDMFFDRAVDPWETDNHINDSQSQSIIDRLRGDLQQWEQTVPLTLPTAPAAHHTCKLA